MDNVHFLRQEPAIPAINLAAHFNVPAVVIINKADINREQAHRIIRIAEQRNSRVVGSIPFDHAVNDALMAGQTVITHGKSAAADAIRNAWTEVKNALKNQDVQVMSHSQ